MMAYRDRVDAMREEFEQLRSVDQTFFYQGSFADFTVMLNEGESNTSEVRVHYLRNHRGDWELVDDSRDAPGRTLVWFKRR